MGGVVLRMSSSMTNWGCGFRGSDRGGLQLMATPLKAI